MRNYNIKNVVMLCTQGINTENFYAIAVIIGTHSNSQISCWDSTEVAFVGGGDSSEDAE